MATLNLDSFIDALRQDVRNHAEGARRNLDALCDVLDQPAGMPLALSVKTPLGENGRLLDQEYAMLVLLLEIRRNQRAFEEVQAKAREQQSREEGGEADGTGKK